MRLLVCLLQCDQRLTCATPCASRRARVRRLHAYAPNPANKCVTKSRRRHCVCAKPCQKNAWQSRGVSHSHAQYIHQAIVCVCDLVPRHHELIIPWNGNGWRAAKRIPWWWFMSAYDDAFVILSTWTNTHARKGPGYGETTSYTA